MRRRVLPHARPGVREAVDLEIGHHIEERTDRLVEAGVPRAEAERQARVAFGDIGALNSEMLEIHDRALGGGVFGPLLDAVRQDAVLAVRQLWKRPGTSLAGIVVLALGISAATVVFSIVDAVIVRPLPFPAPDRLVAVQDLDRSDGSVTRVSPTSYLHWKNSGAGSIEGLIAWSPTGLDMMGAAGPEHVDATAISYDFLEVLGVPPAAGRGFLASEDAPDAPPVVVLSDGLWRRSFGGDPSIVGRSVRFDGRARLVVGIARPTLDFPEGTEAWIPLLDEIEAGPDMWGAEFLDALARLSPGASVEAAAAELSALVSDIEMAPQLAARVTPLRHHLVGTQVEDALFALLGAVLLVLAVACANVGNLLLSRSLGRQRELAVRTALGASGLRLAGAAIAESVALSVLAGLVGIGTAALGLGLLLGLMPDGLPLGSDVHMDGRVLGTALLAALLTGLLAGLPPAMRVVRRDPGRALREGGGHTTAGRGLARLQAGLIVAQVAATVVLLVGAGLLARTFLAIVSQPTGFDPSGLVMADMRLPDHRYPDAQTRRAFYDELLRGVRALPGVRGAALSKSIPIGGRTMVSPVVLEELGGHDPSLPVTQISGVTEDYFEVMDIGLVRGRVFRPEDVDAPGRVVVVNETFARTYFGGAEALGRRARTYFTPDLAEIVGVVRDVRHQGLAGDPPPIFYQLLPREPDPYFAVVARTDLPPAAVFPGLARVLAEVDPELPARRMMSMDEVLSRSVAQPRFYLVLIAGFAAVSLALVMVGFYGVMSGVVQSKLPEIGLRMALGANDLSVRGLVLGRGLRVTALGLTVGLVGALLLTRLLESLLFGVRPTDPLTLVGVSVMLLVTAAGAIYPAVRRATRVDPVAVLNP